MNGMSLENLANRAAEIPDWALSLAGLVLGAAVAVALHRRLFVWLTRAVANRSLFWRSLVARTEGPTRLVLVMIALSAAQGILPLTPGQASALAHLLILAFIALVAWMAQTALYIWTTVYLRRFKLDAEDNLLARKHVTQARILRRVAEILIMIVAVSAGLMTFEGVRQYGVSLLASAGAAGLVVAIALQPLLKNLFAGIQLAITQPIRIDDALLVEGEWGNVEEITSTYVVVRLWDWRRMVLPLSYFIEKPFQNWTRESAGLIGTVTIDLDYAVPMDDLRRKVQEIASSSPFWDGKVVNVQVTDFKETAMQVRILASASNSGRTFDLRCDIREKLVAYLNADHPRALPRMRMDISERVMAAEADRATSH